MEIVDCFQLEKRDDIFIREYNSFFYEKKIEAQKNGDEVSRLIAKLFLNALIGKFSQRTKHIEQIPEYDEESDSVIFRPGEFINNWAKGHFDFIRGAYIYSMARVKIMRDIRTFLNKDGGVISHHFYTDTDSIVTDIEIPKRYISETDPGLYKIEKEYNGFCVLNTKVYWGRLKDGTDDVVSAGITKGVVSDFIHEICGDVTAKQFCDLFKSEIEYPMTGSKRCSGGARMYNYNIKLSDIDVDKYLIF